MQTALQAKRIALLAQNGERLFHIKDLRMWWGIVSPTTLRMTLKRYVDAGLIHRIYRGFYSFLPLEQIHPTELGQKALHEYAYLSTESVLFQEGYLSQAPSTTTFVSAKNMRFTIGSRHFLSRSLSKKYLMNPTGISIQNGIRHATVERAIADLLYFNPKAHFDKPIHWEAVKNMQKQMAYPLTPKRYVTA